MKTILIMLFPLMIIIALFSYVYNRDIHTLGFLEILKNKELKDFDFNQINTSINNLREILKFKDLQSLTTSDMFNVTKIMKIMFQPIKFLYLTIFYTNKFIIHFIWVLAWNTSQVIISIFQYLEGAIIEPFNDKTTDFIDPDLLQPVIIQPPLVEPPLI